MKSLQIWLNEQAKKLQFGEVSVTLKIHQGRITQIKKSITEAEQPEHTSAGSDGNRKF